MALNVKYSEIINSIEILKTISTIKVPMSFTVKLSKAITAIDAEINSYVTFRRSIDDEFIPKDENGEPVFNDENKTQFTPTDINLYRERIAELDNTEITLPIEKLSIEVIDNKITLSVAEFNNISFLFNI